MSISTFTEKARKNQKKLQRKGKKEISYSSGGEAFETLRRRGAQVNDLKIFVLAH
jgi:translation initiation factor IF-2